MNLVIDASSAIELLALPDAAARIGSTFPLIAPGLLAWELGNVIHKRYPRDFGSNARRTALIGTVLQPIELVDQRASLADVAAIVDRHAITFYDASYVSLAKQRQAPLLSSDGALLEVAKKVLGRSLAWDIDLAVEACT